MASLAWLEKCLQSHLGDIMNALEAECVCQLAMLPTPICIEEMLSTIIKTANIENNGFGANGRTVLLKKGARLVNHYLANNPPAASAV